ncbi:MAG TPA: P-loop NTPase [Acidimicrobiales bacterium]
MADYRIVVVEEDPKTRAKLQMQLGEENVAAVPNIEALTSDFPPGTPLVAVFGPSVEGAEGISGVGAFNARGREVGTVVIVRELTTDVLQQAMRAGVRDVLADPVDTSQLKEAVAGAADSIRVEPSRPAVVDTEAAAGNSRVVTVFSTKGGAGKSVIACNLAVALNSRVEGPVVLVDADLQFGDVAVMLKLTPQHTIVDAVHAGGNIDGSYMRNLLAEHPSGVLVLPAPIEPAAADQISDADMRRIISALREFAEYIVVDTPAYFNDIVLGLLDLSEDIVLVGGMDIPNIKNVKLGLQTLRLLNMPMSKLKLILNRANSKVKLDVAEVERTLGVKADCLMPSDIVVPQSVNKGVPAVIDAPKSSVSRSLEAFADLILESAAHGG